MKFTLQGPFFALILLLTCQFLAGQPTLPGTQRGLPGAAARITAHDDHPITCLGFNWNQNTMVWDTASLDSMAYFPNGDRAFKQNWFYNAAQYNPVDRVTYEYDLLGRLVRAITLVWSGASWDSTDIALTAYDPVGNFKSKFVLHWNGVGWDTTSGYRYLNTYNASNQLIERHTAYYDFPNNIWYDNGLERYHRTALGEWDTLTYLYYGTNDWLPMARYTDVVWHDFEDTLFAQFKYQEYDSGAWADRTKGTITYGPNDSYVARYLDFTTTWDSAYMEVVSNDAEGHEILREGSEWANGWVQVHGRRYHYTYDSQLRTEEVWDELWNQGSYQRHRRMVYASFFAVGVPAAQALAGDLHAWPNPVQDVLHLAVPTSTGAVTVSLHDLQGRLRQQWQRGGGSEQLDLQLDPALPAGTYLYSVVGRAGAARGKVVVQR
jgi:hypothetical protein